MTYPWSCLLDAFSLVLNIPSGLIEKWIEHDGGDIIWEGLKEPLCRRGFHIQELIDFCYHNNYYVIPIEAMPSCKPMLGKNIKTFYLFKEEEAINRLFQYVKDAKGIFTGLTVNNKRHAIGWKDNKIIDPAGKIKEFGQFQIETFWMIVDLDDLKNTDQKYM